MTARDLFRSERGHLAFLTRSGYDLTAVFFLIYVFQQPFRETE